MSLEGTASAKLQAWVERDFISDSFQLSKEANVFCVKHRSSDCKSHHAELRVCHRATETHTHYIYLSLSYFLKPRTHTHINSYSHPHTHTLSRTLPLSLSH